MPILVFYFAAVVVVAVVVVGWEEKDFYFLSCNFSLQQNPPAPRNPTIVFVLAQEAMARRWRIPSNCRALV